jgi:hypothetical protein
MKALEEWKEKHPRFTGIDVSRIKKILEEVKTGTA